MLHLHHDLVVPVVRVGEHLLEVVHRGDADIGLIQRFQPLVPVLGGEDLGERLV